MAARAILHVDLDAFFASVEQRDEPSLRGKPVLVGGSGRRGVVMAASYEARRFGCRSAQPTAQALRMCPQAIVVRGRFEAYKESSRAVFAILESFTPRVQPVSIDEAFMDVTGSARLFGDGRAMAEEIRARIRAAVGLTASVGVASNKFLAKLGSDLNKPDGLTVIDPDPQRVQEVLDPLPVGAIFGVGPKMTERLRRMGVRTIRELRAISEEGLRQRFGDYGASLWRLARGIDDRPVHADREARSIGHEQTFGVDLADAAEVRRVLAGQAEDVARRVRRHGLLARTVTVKIRFGDYETITRSRTMEDATDRTDVLFDAAAGLLETWRRTEGFRPVRLIGVQASHFASETQGGLFTAADDEKRRAAEKAADAVVAKFGKGAIRRGAGM